MMPKTFIQHYVLEEIRRNRIVELKLWKSMRYQGFCVFHSCYRDSMLPSEYDVDNEAVWLDFA